MNIDKSSLAQPTRSRLIRRLLAWLLLLVCLICLYLIAPLLVSKSVFQIDDFVEYWAAGQLNLQGLNPYDPSLMVALQHRLGFTYSIMMYNPPYTLALVMPLSLLAYPFARVTWFLVSVLCLAVATTWLWQLAGGSRSKVPLIWALAFFFSPALGTLDNGQISVLVLLGVAGFLWFQSQGRPWVAGVFLALTALKPHGLPLVWLVLLLWSIRSRRWESLLAAAGALSAATIAALVFNPGGLSQYLFAATHSAPIQWRTPTLGGLLRTWMGPEKVWLQFVAAPLGMIWALYYWRLHRVSWDWSVHLIPVIFASVITAVYGWTSDQVVLLVGLVPAIYLLSTSANTHTAQFLAGVGLAFNTAVLLNLGGLEEHAFWWQAPAWLIWYLAVITCCHGSKEETSARLLTRPRPD